MADTPFDSIESAHEYIHLLACQVEDVQRGIEDDLAEAARLQATRRVDALRVVDYKLKQLEHHLGASRRVLNDLRMLRRLLVRDRDDPDAVAEPAARAEPARPPVAASR